MDLFSQGFDKLIVEAEHVRRVAEWWAKALRMAGLHHYAKMERKRSKNGARGTSAYHPRYSGG